MKYCHVMGVYFMKVGSTNTFGPGRKGERGREGWRKGGRHGGREGGREGGNYFRIETFKYPLL